MNFLPWLVFKPTIAHQNETAVLTQQANGEDQRKAGSSGQEVKHKPNLWYNIILSSGNALWSITYVKAPHFGVIHNDKKPTHLCQSKVRRKLKYSSHLVTYAAELCSVSLCNIEQPF